ncbi:FAD binding domain-containing protein [Colletotrichum incanum]|nr:FAD binding domain-containing protein [Colletotrichum incanum]
MFRFLDATCGFDALGAAASLGLYTQALAQLNTTLTGFKGCDALLDAGLGDILSFPADAAYAGSTLTYYSSENRRLRPYCIVQCRSTEYVSIAVKALSRVSGTGPWDIAVRSGGHSDYDNNAINKGITIDLTYLNSTELVKSSCLNGTATWVGQSTLTKNVAQIRLTVRWGEVMMTLEPYNLGVTGGRSGHVGAGALLVPDGASYHTQLYGLSCDNVIGYEVVLADGTIVEANSEENADLFKALKGGGSNSGVVTRFDLRPLYSIDTGNPDHEFLVYHSDSDDLAIMAMAVSTDGNESSPTFAAFDNITLTPDIVNKAADIFVILTQDNILGFDKNLSVDSILFEARSTLTAADAGYGGIVQSKMGKAIEELRRYSASLDGHSTYIYMNYANPEQDVIGSYGADNVKFLKETATKYDPTGFFQYRMPGGWKVSRV